MICRLGHKLLTEPQRLQPGCQAPAAGRPLYVSKHDSLDEDRCAETG